MNQEANDPSKRYDFLLIFDVQDGNPNGDPDAGNLPRLDPETGHGLVTDVCLKRKVRNYVIMTQTKKGSGFDIFVKERAVLNKLIGDAYAELGTDLEKPPVSEKDGKKRETKGKGQGSEVDAARKSLCEKYYDIRTFGAVMSTGANAGQVRGPVQLTFGRSVDVIVTLEHSLTVCAARKEDEPIEGQIGIQGRKNTVPYGLYVAHGFFSPHLAAQTGFGDKDLELLWEAFANMFEHDRSAARGLMSTKKLVLFKHATALGNAPAHKLFEAVTIHRKDDSKPPRAFSDYEVTIDYSAIPEGVEVIERI